MYIPKWHGGSLQTPNSILKQGKKIPPWSPTSSLPSGAGAFEHLTPLPPYLGGIKLPFFPSNFIITQLMTEGTNIIPEHQSRMLLLFNLSKQEKYKTFENFVRLLLSFSYARGMLWISYFNGCLVNEKHSILSISCIFWSLYYISDITDNWGYLKH